MSESISLTLLPVSSAIGGPPPRTASSKQPSLGTGKQPTTKTRHNVTMAGCEEGGRKEGVEGGRKGGREEGGMEGGKGKRGRDEWGMER